MGGHSPVLYRLFVPARHAKKWPKSTRQPKIRRPLGILLIPVKSQQSLSLHIGTLSNGRKILHDHYCCPMSAILFMTSELEADLERLHPVLYAHVERGWGEGGAVSNQASSYQSPVTWRREGGIGSMYYTSADFSFACLSFCRTTFLNKKWTHWIRTAIMMFF